jgi:hypothetical protein
MTTETTMTLAEHLAALNAEKRAWVAEDPDNRWTGLYVEELDFWAEMGVTTVAQFKVVARATSTSRTCPTRNWNVRLTFSAA